MSVGTSILSNYFRIHDLGNPRFGDNEFWEEKEDDRDFLESLYADVESNPYGMSAELNSFLRKVEGLNPEDVCVYLIGTDTPSGKIALKTIERYLDNKGYCRLGTHRTVHGYFKSREVDEDPVEAFKEGMADLMDRLLNLVMDHSDKYKIFFNPTAGFKAHVIVLSIAAALTGKPFYYIHEEFKDVIDFPPLFYIPKEEEKEFLRLLEIKKVLGPQGIEPYVDVIRKLERYNILDVESEDGKVIRVKLSGLGKFLIKEVLK